MGKRRRPAPQRQDGAECGSWGCTRKALRAVGERSEPRRRRIDNQRGARHPVGDREARASSRAGAALTPQGPQSYRRDRTPRQRPYSERSKTRKTLCGNGFRGRIERLSETFIERRPYAGQSFWSTVQVRRYVTLKRRNTARIDRPDRAVRDRHLSRMGIRGSRSGEEIPRGKEARNPRRQLLADVVPARPGRSRSAGITTRRGEGIPRRIASPPAHTGRSSPRSSLNVPPTRHLSHLGRDS